MIKRNVFIATLIALVLSGNMSISANATKVNPNVVERTAFAFTSTSDNTVIRLQFPNMIEYMDGNSRVRLFLDESTITTRPTQSPTYTYRTTKTREITGLSRNDPALVERTWEGKALVDVSFTRTGDKTYTAHAVYAGIATGTRDVSYISTAKYFGERSLQVDFFSNG